MLAPDDIKDILIVLIGALFGGGLAFLVNFYRHKRTADLAVKVEEDRHEIDGGKLAIELMQAQRQRIDQLVDRVDKLEGEQDKLREAANVKDTRIAELERKTAEQEAEITELRKKLAEKDALIKQLTTRLEAIEKGKAVQPGRGK